jgi:hypothetical protein
MKQRANRLGNAMLIYEKTCTVILCCVVVLHGFQGWLKDLPKKLQRWLHKG